jgi:hypothetical protein
MSRRHLCDTPGCGKERKRWQRLCSRCFFALPGDIRTGLVSAFKEHRMADWRQWKKRACEYLATPRPPRRPPIDSATAYERTARLLGEH